MAKVFLTGATGFLGGEVLTGLVHRSRSISCLVRDKTKAQQVTKAFPDVRIVNGDLDDVKVIEEEAKNADIVLHLASTKHMPSSEAIVKGLGNRAEPGYWIQMSGASLFSIPEIKSSTYGEAGGKIYDDLNDRDEIVEWITSNPSRAVDNLVLGQNSIKTALIVGPIIYGYGKGPVNTRSIQIPETTKYTLKSGKGFQVGKGKSIWSSVHVSDIGSLIVKLVEAAEANKTGLWNRDGIYFPENGSIAFGEISAQVAKEAHRRGLIESPDVTQNFSAEEAENVMPHAAILLGTNANLKGSRARQLLGWQPAGESIQEHIPKVVEAEAK